MLNMHPGAQGLIPLAHRYLAEYQFKLHTIQVIFTTIHIGDFNSRDLDANDERTVFQSTVTHETSALHKQQLYHIPTVFLPNKLLFYRLRYV